MNTAVSVAAFLIALWALLMAALVTRRLDRATQHYIDARTQYRLGNDEAGRAFRLQGDAETEKALSSLRRLTLGVAGRGGSA